ncbi:MAG: transglycosylase domain-containing protein [Chitinophaga sp.]|uniref:biosynthetic peptidoglycan transglycosylase n=1 Tax=Chitinophaga sp. TaxID=1869181 RepID=UPI0025C193DD|nr:biosynthetic peptidoglycan transglycosylase [Chitinophaga sp.]MBV8252042.1 transglycosylase domain-containing protein [Chitinophaga sp.]
MKVLQPIFQKLIHKLIPSRIQVRYNRIRYRFPGKVILREACIAFNTWQTNIDIVEITVNNPILMLLARKRFRITGVKCGNVEIMQQPAQQATAMDQRTSRLPKKNFIALIHFCLNRYFQPSTCIELNKLTWKSFILQQLSVRNHVFQFNFLFRNEKLYFKGDMIPSNNAITIKGNAHIDGDYIHAENMDITSILQHSSEQLLLKYTLDGRGLTCHTRKLSPTPISIAGFHLEDQVKIDQTTIENDMNIVIGDMPVKISNTLTYAASKVLNAVFATRLDKSTLAWILPYLSTDIKNIQYEGGITLIANLGLNLDNILGHKFDVFIQDYDFKAGDLAALKLDRLNYPFSQLVFKDGLAVRKLRVKNGYFNKYEQADTYQLLRKIIIFCEDPSFLHHKGVDPYFIGRSIVTNLKEKKFSRGGSTITMQLIRNLFLAADKSLVRKFEEVLISLLLENHAGVTKSRILDIYLQIVEFGPNIYGIKEAANYYFGKQLDELHAVDCIVLTYILPRPVYFNDALLIRSQQLQVNLSTYCRNISNFLQQNGILTAKAYNTLPKQVVFSKRWENFTVEIE